MFDTDDFAEEAVFTITTAPMVTRTVNVIFEQHDGEIAIYDRSFYDEKFYSAIVETGKPFITCLTENLAGVKRNTPLQLRGKQWYVFKGPIDDGFGISLIFVSKDRA